VDCLSKAYRIGLKEEIPDTLLGAAKGVLCAPWRNWRRLRRLSTYGGEMKDERSGMRDDADAADPLSLNPHRSSPAPDEPDTIWALKDVTFEVREGEVVGVIGRNGAGKSTLLKILSRITEPTRGRAELRGRVSSLLEVGTGFHPELTGRENVYLNGTILGMTKREIDRKFDEIVDFSGVEKFLDTPVKRYSSGMTVRLAFAVAAHLEPEILIIDEVLAVGDAEFQRKCLGKMQDVARGGRTVLFVSHNMAAVKQLCPRAILLYGGRVAASGRCADIVGTYLSKYARGDALDLRESTDRDGDGRVRITRLSLLGSHEVEVSHWESGNFVSIELEYAARETVQDATFYIAIYDLFGQKLSLLSNRCTGTRVKVARGTGTLRCQIPRLPLAPGQYRANVAVLDEEHRLMDRVESAMNVPVHAGAFYGDRPMPNGDHGYLLIDQDWQQGSDSVLLDNGGGGHGRRSDVTAALH
jgi:lipopolysaccharide transport system ATP-binding protein